MLRPRTTTKLGADLVVGDIVVQALPNGSLMTHRIAEIAPYPYAPHLGTYGPGNARIVYGGGGPKAARWRKTAPDASTFQILSGWAYDNAAPPDGRDALDRYDMPPLPALVEPAPIADPATTPADPAALSAADRAFALHTSREG